MIVLNVRYVVWCASCFLGLFSVDFILIAFFSNYPLCKMVSMVVRINYFLFSIIRLLDLDIVDNAFFMNKYICDQRKIFVYVLSHAKTLTIILFDKI